jgi:hypothetical protein
MIDVYIITARRTVSGLDTHDILEGKYLNQFIQFHYNPSVLNPFFQSSGCREVVQRC